jgi:hypothetical protein
MFYFLSNITIDLGTYTLSTFDITDKVSGKSGPCSPSISELQDLSIAAFLINKLFVLKYMT